MTMTQVDYPTVTSVDKAKSTLLDVAQVTDQFKWLDGKALFDSYNCLTFSAEANFCAPNTKSLSQGAGWQDGLRFAAYGGVVCRAVGLDQDEMRAGVSRAFDVGESTAVEKALMKYRFVASNGAAAERPGVWAAPVDITPAGGAVRPAVGIALLEEYAGSVYVGAPTLHVPRSIASIVLGVNGAEYVGNVLETRSGSKIAAGAGYAFPNTSPTGAAAAAGERWVYATGEVWVGQGPPELHGPVLNQSTNDVVMLAERGYVVAVDCFTAAIRVIVE